MAFTIDKMMQLREFSDCCLVAGSNGKTREIRCVDMMEVPDITPWLKPDELLVTTGYSIAGRTDLLSSLLDAMHAVGSAGLAIKTRFIGPLPQEILERAEKYELPLVVMPDDKAFIPLISALGNCIAEEDNEQLLFSLAVSKEISAAQQSENYIRSIEEIIYRY
ncbi:MAG: PucR family transcriptional regulator ligand-binding domain-containing protein, partial [Oscillibacter sp.]|nr:PucR family transcriptional regulator ligand-binding domain-containing protein [Oscillibacter sp.]